MHAELAPDLVLLHDGEHEVRVWTSEAVAQAAEAASAADGEKPQAAEPARDVVTITARSLHSGDRFERTLGAQDIGALLEGWPAPGVANNTRQVRGLNKTKSLNNTYTGFPNNVNNTRYRGRLFSNAVAKFMVIFSNRQEAAFSNVLRILICQ